MVGDCICGVWDEGLTCVGFEGWLGTVFVGFGMKG